MISIEADTPTELYKKVLLDFLYDGRDIFKESFVISSTADSVRSGINDVELIIRQPLAENFNLGLSGYHFPMRWSKFFYEYTQAEPFSEFLDQSKLLQPFQVSGFTCAVRAKHNLGNCLHAATYRAPALGKPGRVTLYSRSSLFAPVGVLDIGFGLSIIKWLEQNSRQRIKDGTIELAWVCSQLQFMSWKALLPIRMFHLIKNKEDLPDTKTGKMIYSHILDAERGTLPTLRMFARQGRKYVEFEAEGKFDSPEIFYPEIPDSHRPGYAGKFRDGDIIDYSIEATEWLEDTNM